MKLRKDRRLARRKAEGKKNASSELKPKIPKQPRRAPGDPWDAPSCKSCATFLRVYSSKMAERFSAKVVEHVLRCVVIAQTNAMKTKIRFPSATHCQAPDNASCNRTSSMGQKADSRTYTEEYV